MQEYKGGDGWHGSTVTFRSANLNSYVEFEGIGSTYGNGPAYRSREYVESAAYQLAAEVNRSIGKPR